MSTAAIILNLLLMIAALAAAIYAHARLPYHTATARQVVFTRALLIAVGLAAGWVGTRYAAPYGSGVQLIAFLTGLGLVHIPAAFILYSKRLRGVSR